VWGFGHGLEGRIKDEGSEKKERGGRGKYADLRENAGRMP
jgi:hypothetical protein